jgi:hypothetical protein
MRIIVTISLLLAFLTSFAQIERLNGPRFGTTFITKGSTADYLNDGINFNEDENGGFGNTGTAFTTQYGWQWETRFADGGENFIGIVEWVALIAGLNLNFIIN